MVHGSQAQNADSATQQQALLFCMVSAEHIQVSAAWPPQGSLLCLQLLAVAAQMSML